jgi:hypothetical protein
LGSESEIQAIILKFGGISSSGWLLRFPSLLLAESFAELFFR